MITIITILIIIIIIAYKTLYYCALCAMFDVILCRDPVVDTLLFTPRGARGIWILNITTDQKTRDSASFAFLYNISSDI